MQILYHKTEPTFLNIWLIRLFVGVEFVLLLGGTFKLFKTENLNDIIFLVAFLLVFSLILVFHSMQNIVYLDEEEIILKGIFEDLAYNYSDFVKVSVRSKFFGVVYMEFSDGKKYHLVYKEIRANGYGNLFEDYKEIASHLELRVHQHFKQLDKAGITS